MKAWVGHVSQNGEFETKGYFVARKEGRNIIVDDFVPMSSYVQNAKTSGELKHFRVALTDEQQQAKSGSLRFVSDTNGIDPKYRDMPKDHNDVEYLDFHSHFNTSKFQEMPSGGDLQGLTKVDTAHVLFTPNPDGTNEGGNLILFRKSNDPGLREFRTSNMADVLGQPPTHNSTSPSYKPE